MNTKKRIVIPLVILVVIAVIGYFAVSSQSGGDGGADIGTGGNGSASESEEITYTNSKYGFEFSYPDYYEISEVSPESIQLVSRDLSHASTTIYVYVNLATGFEGWDEYKSYGAVTGTGGRKSGDIISLQMGDEERRSQGLSEPKYIFLSVLRPVGDGPRDTYFVITSSWLDKVQVDDPRLEKDFEDLVKSVRMI